MTPASRRQDHTTSPSTFARFVKRAISVHRIPSRVRDDREPPLCGTGPDRSMPASSNSSSVISENPKTIANRYPPPGPFSQDRTRRNQFPDRHELQATRFRGAVNTALDQFCADPVRLPRLGTRKSGLTGRHCPIAITPVNDAGTVAGHRARPLAAGPVAQWLEPAAHNGLVAGSSPAGPTSEASRIRGSLALLY